MSSYKTGYFRSPSKWNKNCFGNISGTEQKKSGNILGTTGVKKEDSGGVEVPKIGQINQIGELNTSEYQKKRSWAFWSRCGGGWCAGAGGLGWMMA